MNSQIVLLDRSDLDLARALALRLFPAPGDRPDESLAAIFAPHRHPQDIHRGIFDRVCWVWFESEVVGGVHRQPLGIIGLYRRLEDYADALHLGWFGVEPTFRHRSIGLALLQHAIAEARAAGAAWLRLDTTDEAEAAAANRLYDRVGFAVIRTAPSGDGPHNTVWRELRLTA